MVEQSLVRGLGPNFVASGDNLDTSEEDGFRIVDKVPITPAETIESAGTNIFMTDAGTGTIGDGLSATGSTASVSFNTAYTSNPNVVATGNGWGNALSSYVGSRGGFVRVGLDTGSAVFLGPSGAGFDWFSYGKKY